MKRGSECGLGAAGRNVNTGRFSNAAALGSCGGFPRETHRGAPPRRPRPHRVPARQMRLGRFASPGTNAATGSPIENAIGTCPGGK